MSNERPPNTVPFTQYLRPNGARREVWIERPAPVIEAANVLLAKGFTFECEELSDCVTVSLTISDGEQDVAMECVPNGPQVPDAVDRLILKFKKEG